VNSTTTQFSLFTILDIEISFATVWITSVISVNFPAFKASRVALCLLLEPRNLSQILSLYLQERFKDF
jgi:hypothetical protein